VTKKPRRPGVPNSYLPPIKVSSYTSAKLFVFQRVEK
jgi:hypothetical protein